MGYKNGNFDIDFFGRVKFYMCVFGSERGWCFPYGCCFFGVFGLCY